MPETWQHDSTETLSHGPQTRKRNRRAAITQNRKTAIIRNRRATETRPAPRSPVRIQLLQQTMAEGRIVSVHPLLGQMGAHLTEHNQVRPLVLHLPQTIFEKFDWEPAHAYRSFLRRPRTVRKASSAA